MKRFYIAAVAGVCAVGSAGAQEGALAPTVPVVPPPMLQNGNLVAPGGGAWGTSGSRLFARSTWSPVRNPVVAAPGFVAPTSGFAVPPLPAGVGCSDGSCGPGGCARGGMSLDRLKAWLCFRLTPTELPKLRPAPYVTPIQGLFSCTSGAGCASGCATGNYTPGTHAPAPQPGALPPAPPVPMTVPAQPTGGAGAVLMPSRGTQGAAAQSAWAAWPAPASAETGLAGYRFAAPESQTMKKPAQGPVVSAGYQRPGQR